MRHFCVSLGVRGGGDDLVHVKAWGVRGSKVRSDGGYLGGAARRRSGWDICGVDERKRSVNECDIIGSDWIAAIEVDSRCTRGI